MEKQFQSRTLQLLIAVFFILDSDALFSQSIDQNHTGTSINYFNCEQTSVISQSFTAGLTGLLSEIKVDIDAQFCPFNANLDTIAFAANIYNGNGPTGTLLSSQNVVINIPFTRSLLPITFNNPALLTANNQYTIELKVNTGQICDAQFGININFYWYSSSSNDYLGGQPYSSLTSGLTNDLYFQTYITTVSGIEENAENKTTIFPNPASELLNIETSTNEKLQIEIYSAIGEKVMNKKMESNETFVINTLSAGMYFVKIISEDKNFTTKKIQVVK